MYIVWICYERTWQYTTGECHSGMETCSHCVKDVFSCGNCNILFTAAIKQTVEDTSIRVAGQIRETTEPICHSIYWSC